MKNSLDELNGDFWITEKCKTIVGGLFLTLQDNAIGLHGKKEFDTFTW